MRRRSGQGAMVQVLLNGKEIGTISGEGPISSEFSVSRDLFRAGRENELQFKTDGPVGVKVISVQFR